MKKIKFKKELTSALIIFVLLVTLILSVIFGMPFERIFYWYILVSWIILIGRLKLKSNFSLVLGLVFLIIGVFINLTGFVPTSEIIMRISFIGFIIGIIQAFTEYIIAQKSTPSSQ